ncbi:CCA tRNA nucleotidyltransferase [Lactobacillus sp. PV037]|uniref:CCA tRNA nucleotidyltransferase n=1 Tax=unclassified Lactobacillus TaxID=2620435 RepID=UPI00223F6A6D|nr:MULTISPECIES: CCA tRNA nucleotidyltransferase [unclassified Lactobacillus]QNQ82357.1 CCA tRNA nucleotidyltransferase [Lactobacillus sp. PV012]QNQ83529.1 CCA tRNA nucleotidyltransferase [Lactobacillus sp. PV037]
MKIEKLSPVFTKALPVLKEIISAGYEAYFVGGSVRDLLLDRHIHDVDIATSAYPEEIKRIFQHTIDTGIQHGTVTVRYDHESYEVTTFRTESGYQDFRRPDHVSFVQNLSEDLKRRDFTINALAMDIEGNIIDHFNGLEDLKKKVIRAVGVAENRFHEDALRMMRAVRFMGQLKFSLEEKTKQAIKDNHELLSKIAVERVREEFVKMGTSPGSQEAFELFLETELYQEVPFFAGKRDALAIFPKLNFSPSTEENLWTTMIVLLKLNTKDVPKFMRAWKNSNAMIHQVTKIIEFFDLISDTTPSNYELFKSDLKTILATIDLAHILGQPINGSALYDRYEALPVKSAKELAIDGKFLLKSGIPAGPKIGELLDTITEAVVEGKIANNEEEISAYLQTL